MATFLQTQRRRLRDHLKQRWAKLSIETIVSTETVINTETVNTETVNTETVNTETVVSTETVVEVTEVCSKCRQISARLEELIDRGFGNSDERTRLACDIDPDGLDLKPLSITQYQLKKCSFCNFLAHMFEASGAIWENRWVAGYRYLYIGSAKEQYGISKHFSHIPDSFCVWIQSKRQWGNKQVPLLPYHSDQYGKPAGIALEVSNNPGTMSSRLVRPYADFELIKSWLDDCTMHHGTTTCQTDASILQDITAFRVIDCSSRSLVLWSQIPTNQDRNYVALSYVWGAESSHGNERKAFWSTWSPLQNAVVGIRNHKTVEKPEAQTTDWRLPSKLPPLIEDTITAVIKLGFKYLWIDRYCIPQGNQEAKHAQIQNMDSIYGSASLTIIAAAGNDPSHGLPGVSFPRYGHDRPNKNPPVSVRIGSRTFATVATAGAYGELKDSKWNSRAWTMQEFFLSCRCLVFLDDGAYFQCSSPSSHRYEAIHEPSALLQLRHEVLSTDEQNRTKSPAESLFLTKMGKAGDLERGWCLQLVEDYFPRSLTFENDTLNAFSGMLKYLQSLKPSIHNLWGVLMLPDVLSTSSGQRIRYNLVRGLAWSYIDRDGESILSKLEKLKRSKIPPRKEMFPSWTWADWRSRVEFHDEGGDDRKCAISYHLQLPRQDSGFTSLVDLSVELDDGRIVSWAQGYLYDSDVSWLATLPNPPRILHIQGYTANPQLQYMTETVWAEFNERSTLPREEYSRCFIDCLCFYSHPWIYNVKNNNNNNNRWVFIDADGQHLQPLLEPAYRKMRTCWRCEKGLDSAHSSTNGNFSEKQRGSSLADTIKPHTEFNLRAIVLGYDQRGAVYFMLLMKADNQTETFERIDVRRRQYISSYWLEKNPAWVEEFLDNLTGEHAEPARGTPWVKMNTRIA